MYYVRFRVDSAPTWYATAVEPWDASGRVAFRLLLSEVAELTASRLDVRYDGVAAPSCYPDFVDVAYCAAPSTGARVTLELSGPTIVDLAGNGPVVMQNFVYAGRTETVYFDADFGFDAADAAGP